MLELMTQFLFKILSPEAFANLFQRASSFGNYVTLFVYFNLVLVKCVVANTKNDTGRQ